MIGTFSPVRYNRYRVAAQAAGYIWRNRAKISEIGKRILSPPNISRINRIRMPRVSLFRKHVGNPIGTTKSKREQVVRQDEVTQTQNLVYGYNMLQIDRSSLSDEINLRERLVCNLKGVKINFMFKNLLDRPCITHIALVTFKDQGSELDATTNMFRNFTGDRSVNYASNNSAMLQNNFPLNADKFWIHFHKRLYLGGKDNYDTTSATKYTHNRANIRMFRKYVKFYRQVRFTSAETADNTNLWLLVWHCAADKLISEVSTTPANVQIWHNSISYFSDPKP